MTYLTRFLLNAIVLPLTLILLVAGTWKANTHERQLCRRTSAKGTNGAKKDDTKTPANDGYDELQASKYSDYYFAIFLCCKSWSQPIESDCAPKKLGCETVHTCVIRFAACTDPTMTQVQTSNVKLQVWSVCALSYTRVVALLRADIRQTFRVSTAFSRSSSTGIRLQHRVLYRHGVVPVVGACCSLSSRYHGCVTWSTAGHVCSHVPRFAFDTPFHRTKPTVVGDSIPQPPSKV